MNKIKRFLEDCCEIVDNPEEADFQFTEQDCWIAVLPVGHDKPCLYISPQASDFAWRNREGFIWGTWDELRALVRGKKVFDWNIPITQEKPFSDHFLPCDKEISRKERRPVFAPI